MALFPISVLEGGSVVQLETPGALCGKVLSVLLLWPFDLGKVTGAR